MERYTLEIFCKAPGPEHCSFRKCVLAHMCPHYKQWPIKPYLISDSKVLNMLDILKCIYLDYEPDKDIPTPTPTPPHPIPVYDIKEE